MTYRNAVKKDRATVTGNMHKVGEVDFWICTITTALWPLYRSLCVIWHSQIKMIALGKSFIAYMSLLRATNTFELERRHRSSPQRCYLHHVCTININLPQVLQPSTVVCTMNMLHTMLLKQSHLLTKICDNILYNIFT